VEAIKLGFTVGAAVMAVFFALAAVGAALLNGAKMSSAAKFCRSRKLGLPLAAAVLALCVPQAEPIVWSWLAKCLWFLAAAALFLAWKYLDYLTSRAVAGLLIIGAYLFVNAGYALHLPASGVGAVVAFGWAIFGMYVSACPYRLRDLLWAACKRRGVRLATSGVCAATALYLAWAVVATCLR